MAPKMAKPSLSGVHTSGIFANDDLDGPEIGTLVVIVDRARNLPNRKTMGKQNPYCAARLGKEAKKTETDRRGGQTPRWDQELRFTVHDSPDYYKLKLSVFNDDRKTDLIGETWLPLDTIILPGGGQKDQWYGLQCKGRNAGEVRMEITYYDTRPREEKPVEARPETSNAVGPEHTQVSVTGPRQPKPVKRRPLPLDPTSTEPSPLRPSLPDHVQSSPLPYTPTRLHHHPNGPSPHSARPSLSGHTYATAPMPASNDMSSSAGPKQRNQPEYYDDVSHTNHASNQYPIQGNEQYPSSIAADPYLETRIPQGPVQDYGNPGNGSFPADELHLADQTYRYQGIDLPQLPPLNPRSAMSDPYSLSQQYTSDGFHTTPVSQYQIASEDDEAQGYSADDVVLAGLQLQRSPDSLPLHHQLDYDNSNGPIAVPDVADVAPPPPPAHRSSPAGPSHRNPEQEQMQVYAPIPLSLRPGRGSFASSPLSQSYSHMQQTPRTAPAILPPAIQATSRSDIATIANDPYVQSGGRPSQEPVIYSSQAQYDQLPNSVHLYGSGASMPNIHPSSGFDGRMYGHQGRSNDMSEPIRDPRFDDGMPHQQRSGPTSWGEDSQDPRGHRTSVPIILPRMPVRKSLSPQPEPEQKLSSIAFSPDSFDVLNPNLGSARSINEPGPKYNTPEQIGDAARAREMEKRLETGPIIGSDGRVIDPSDHLPTETWAPEPEKKPLRKGPEIKLRFRHSPHGAQPMPSSGPRSPRGMVTLPQVSSTAYLTDAVDSISLGAGRSRLQKKIRVTTAASPRLLANGTVPPGYPLTENPNHGYGNSPEYLRNSSAAPPPVPAKVPMGMGQEEWNGYALSQEICNIDIGVGADSRLARRNRYGP